MADNQKRHMSAYLIAALLALCGVALAQLGGGFTQVPIGGATATGLPYVIYPHALSTETGAGSEGSHWTNSTDHTAGIQSAATSLGSVRGGQVALAPGLYEITTSITLDTTTPGVTISSGGAGFPSQPNAEAKGITGAMIQAGASMTSGNMINLGGGNSTTRPGGITLKDFEIWGYGTAPDANTGCISQTAQADTVVIRGIRFGNCGTGYYGNGSDNLTIEGTFSAHMGYPFLLAGGDFNELNFSLNQIYDSDYNVVITGNSGNEGAVTGNKLLRLCRANGCSGGSNPSGMYINLSELIIANNTIQDSGGDQLIIASANNPVTGNHFGRSSAGPSGAGVHVTSTAVNTKIAGNSYTNLAVGILVDAGATGTVIWEDPSISITNNGTATLINGFYRGVTGSIGGGALAAGACATGTVTISGATTSMKAGASPAAGADPTNGGVLGVSIVARVSAANTVTVSVCPAIAGTPAAATYQVRVAP